MVRIVVMRVPGRPRGMRKKAPRQNPDGTDKKRRGPPGRIPPGERPAAKTAESADAKDIGTETRGENQGLQFHRWSPRETPNEKARVTSAESAYLPRSRRDFFPSPDVTIA